MRRRSRSRRSGSSGWGAIAVALTVLAVTAGGGIEAGAFSTAGADRQSSIDVASDPEGALGVDTAVAVHVNSTERLVNVTNHLGREVTVTVELRSGSTDRGDLVVDGVNEGNRTSMTLGRGESLQVDVAVVDDSTLVGESIRFDVRGSTAGLRVSANDRSVPIEG